jgi:hypothetical protein
MSTYSTRASKTAVELASEHNKTEVVKFITKYKTEPNILRSTTLDAAQDGADENRMGRERLRYRGRGEHRRREVIARTGNQYQCTEFNYQTPLAIAECKGNVEVVRLLIEGADVDSRDQYDQCTGHHDSDTSAQT